MASPFKLRRCHGPYGLSENEFNRLQPLVAGYVREIPVQVTQPWTDREIEKSAASLRAQFRAIGQNALVVYHRDEPVGFVHYRLLSKKGKIKLAHLYLRPDFRGRGLLARLALPELARTAQRYGLQQLETTELLESGKAWFERARKLFEGKAQGNLRAFKGSRASLVEDRLGRPLGVIRLAPSGRKAKRKFL